MSANQTIERNQTINGINVTQLRTAIDHVRREPAAAQTRFAVKTDWVGGGVSRTRVSGFEMGGQWIEREFEFFVDEPYELCGSNTHPNPQEYLLGALNACMAMGYVAGAALYGVELQSLQIETEGNIDLRGFLGVSKTVPAGYDELRYTVRIKGNGTEEQMRKIHEMVVATSPNRFNISQPIELKAELIIE
jgi:uncharacterized OsmC-like protein